MSSGKQSKDDHADDLSIVDAQTHAVAQDLLSPKKSRFSLKAAKDDLVDNRMVYFMAASAAFGPCPSPRSCEEERNAHYDSHYKVVCSLVGFALLHLCPIPSLTLFVQDTGLIGGILSSVMVGFLVNYIECGPGWIPSSIHSVWMMAKVLPHWRP